MPVAPADRYGLPLSTTAAARDDYVAGVDCILSANAGAEEHLGRALAADSAFALAQIALARALLLAARVPQAREHAARARELAAGATPREQSHVNALALAIEGNPAGSLEAIREHVAEHPRDAMVLAPAAGVFGLIGFSGRQARESELYELFSALAPHYGDDWWFGSALAFAACECGRLDEAGSLIERSMAAKPRNPHGAHIKVHVLYERGEHRAALDYLEDWMPAYPRQGLMHCHLSWHVALAALALGDRERAWRAYREGVHPVGGAWGPPLNVATDAPSFLWRAELAGEPHHGALWSEARDYALQNFPKAGVPFADVHVALACAASGDGENLERVIRQLREREAAGRLPPGPVVPKLAEAFAAYARSDLSRAIELLEAALPETVRIGGSRAQRDVVEFTLRAACVQAGRTPPERRSATA
ncbi:MAG TPA: tetratricopeptide repeat protein [Burkholderiales bacterium]|nr:tetratricopeptide repeat protein [Burkholderiales bacterium]